MSKRAYNHIIKNSLSEPTGTSDNIFVATSSKSNIIPIEEEIKTHFACYDDIYNYLPI